MNTKDLKELRRLLNLALASKFFTTQEQVLLTDSALAVDDVLHYPSGDMSDQ